MEPLETMTEPSVVNNLVENIRGSFENLWEGILNIIPSIAEGLVILLVGWIIAKIVSRAIAKVVEVIRLDNLLATAGVKGFFQRAGIKLNIEKILEEIIKWFILIIFFISAANAFGLPQVNEFLSNVLAYIPNLIIASIIVVLGFLIANFVADLAHGTTKATKSSSAQIVSAIVRWAIIIFTAFTALGQLGIGKELLASFFNNLGLALAAAFGLAFGLGGKEAAADAIKRLRQNVGKSGKK